MAPEDGEKSGAKSKCRLLLIVQSPLSLVMGNGHGLLIVNDNTILYLPIRGQRDYKSECL